MKVLRKKNSNWMMMALLPLWLGLGFGGDDMATVENDSGPAAITNTCSIQNKAFFPGEEIIYKVYYNLNFIWIPAGEVVFKVEENNKEYHLSARGRTYASYEWFFKVRDNYDSYVNKRSLLPSLSIRDVREGGYTLYEKSTFDQQDQSVHVVRGRSKDKIKENKTFEIESCMHDILSIIYYARNLDFDEMEEGDKMPIKIFLDKETWPLNVVYRGREYAKKIKGQGRYNTILFSPEVIEGSVFKEGTEMKVWVSNDDNKIPLLIESPVSVGSIKAVIKDYKGLRYDMEAEVK